MGVTGLWTVVQPCARPIKIETLNKKRLAVDASIWIYQFLKAVRDKEGNALRNSHVVGFFRRICKLLFIGIKPVFVFDGGAPALKRQTINARKSRREGRRDDAVRTAGKLLAMQMQRRAEEEERRRKEEAQQSRQPGQAEEEELPDNLVYVEELNMTEQERKKNRNFRKKDAYHLPELDVSLSEMGAPNDPRIMSHEELEEYARQFHTGEEINLYDFNKIDFNSPFFQSLPPSDRYNILNAARLRSRLRMGYSKEQLDTMFPDRMAFSKFQIERVRERNELTQRLMNLNGMTGEDFNGPGRVAGERGKEYVLVKNEGVEGGWALGVVSNKDEGQREKPIDVEEYGELPKQNIEDDEWEDVDGFIDVPIEGLNRLPKRQPEQPTGIEALTSDRARDARKSFYEFRRDEAYIESANQADEVDDDPDALFLPPEATTAAEDEDMDDLFEDVLPTENNEDDDEELQRAIALSLEQDDDIASQGAEDGAEDAANRAAMLNGPRIDKPLDFNEKNAKAGRAFAHVTNSRAQSNVKEAVSYTPESTQPNKAPGSGNNGFSGPLPFESINLGKSFLRPKKKAEMEGGFEKEADQKKAQPLPPWFSGDIRADSNAQKALEEADVADDNREPRQITPVEPVLRRQDTREVIDIDDTKATQEEPIEVQSSEDDGSDIVMGDVRPVPKAQPKPHSESPESASPREQLRTSVEAVPTMDDVAENVKADPPSSRIQDRPQVLVEDIDSSVEDMNEAPLAEDVEWSESDHETTKDKMDSAKTETVQEVASEHLSTRSSSPEFEDVGIPAAPVPQPPEPKVDEVEEVVASTIEDVSNTLPADVEMLEDDFSDPEDEDLMRQLAAEAEEHARFASAINASSQLQTAEDYERELKQLRNQQKKDRRDADEVTQVMIQECQQLLQLFGLPYITAPMEAEAQCAELVTLGLVDGIVTDDSDIFLFGGTRVYKNMFNQAKFVECYLSSDLEKEYSLTRDKVIQIAHLLGSDYTEGLPNVGPVTALEILSEFPTLDGFKEWWSGVQNGSIPASEDAKNPFRRKFRKNATKLFLPPIFPDRRVDEAYLHPAVDDDPSAFQWGVPDLDKLRAFLMSTIGWGQERADEILVPVIRDMNKREQEGTQSNITQFFGGSVGTGAIRQRVAQSSNELSADASAIGTTSEGFAPRRRGLGKSKRMETALGKLHQRATHHTRDETSDEEAEDQPRDEPSTSSKKRNAGTRKRTKGTERKEVSSESDTSDGGYEPPKKAKRGGKKTSGSK